MKRKLERCRKCRESKAILKVVRFYGKLSYICQDCERETRDFGPIKPEYIHPYFYTRH